MENALQNICQQLLCKIKKEFEDNVRRGTLKNEWGFEFLYSPRSSCDTATKILILTTNPGVEPRKKRYEIPQTPWTQEHAFWRGSFRTQGQFKALFWELAQIFAPDRFGETGKVARDFADNDVIAASLAPFRTPRAKYVTKDMWRFACEELWPEIFKVWVPRCIIAIGRPPYDFVCDILKRNGYEEVQPEHEEILKNTCRGRVAKNRWTQLEKNGNRVTVANFLHFAEYSHFPRKFPEERTENPEGRAFLRTAFGCTL